VYASPNVSPRSTQHAVPAGRHPLPGGTCTLGFQCKVSAASLVISHRRFLLTQVSLAHRARNRARNRQLFCSPTPQGLNVNSPGCRRGLYRAETRGSHASPQFPTLRGWYRRRSDQGT
jgi:hypothetical protein